MLAPLCRQLNKLLLNYTPISSTDLVLTGYIAFVHTVTMPCLSSVSRNVHHWSLSNAWLKTQSDDGNYVGNNKARYPQHFGQ